MGKEGGVDTQKIRCGVTIEPRSQNLWEDEELGAHRSGERSPKVSVRRGAREEILTREKKLPRQEDEEELLGMLLSR